MAFDGRVAKRYARALFNASKAEGMVAAVDADLTVVAGTIQSSAGLRDFMARPSTGELDKLALFDKVFGDRITSLTHSMLKLMVQKRRDENITAVSKAFSELRRRDEQVTKAVVTGAVPLDGDAKKKVVAKLEGDLGHKVEAEFHVDEALIGGVKIVYDDIILDGSVRGQLDKMRDKLIYDVLKQS